MAQSSTQEETAAQTSQQRVYQSKDSLNKQGVPRRVRNFPDELFNFGIFAIVEWRFSFSIRLTYVSAITQQTAGNIRITSIVSSS